MARATRATISQSARASPGGLTARRISVMLRSELIITPSASAHRAPGSRTSACRFVSVSRNASWQMTSSALSSPASTLARFGTVATGLVQMIHTALMSPAAMRLNIVTASGPGSGRMLPSGRPHNASAKARSAGSATTRWPGRLWLM